MEEIVVIISDSSHTLVGQRAEQIFERSWELVIPIVAGKDSLVERYQVIYFEVLKFFENVGCVRVVPSVSNVPNGFLLLGFQFLAALAALYLPTLIHSFIHSLMV